jgi:hypothetical protein
VLRIRLLESDPSRILGYSLPMDSVLHVNNNVCSRI